MAQIVEDEEVVQIPVNAQTAGFLGLALKGAKLIGKQAFKRRKSIGKLMKKVGKSAATGVMSNNDEEEQAATGGRRRRRKSRKARKSRSRSRSRKGRKARKSRSRSRSRKGRKARKSRSRSRSARKVTARLVRNVAARRRARALKNM